MSSFFISYSRKDFETASKIRDHICRLDSGHDVFLDSKSIKPGANWKSELERRIKLCDYFILIYSKDSSTSQYVKLEMKWALDSELKTGVRKLFVYRLSGAELDESFSQYQILDATDNFTIDFFRLMQGIFSENSFYSVEYDIKLQDEYWYEGNVWIEAPAAFLQKIQMVEYRFDYGWDNLELINIVKKSNKANLKNKFTVKFKTKYHFTLFVMIYLCNTKEIAVVRKIQISH